MKDDLRGLSIAHFAIFGLHIRIDQIGRGFTIILGCTRMHSSRGRPRRPGDQSAGIVQPEFRHLEYGAVDGGFGRDLGDNKFEIVPSIW